MSKHLISNITTIENTEGNIDTYISPILGNIKKDNETNLDDIKLTRKIIEKIKYIEGGLGLFSSKLMNHCEFQEKFYDNIVLFTIKIATLLNFHYPYNSIQSHPNNLYKFDCLELFFKMKKNVLFLKEKSFPKIINIKRSSGKIQKALINPEYCLSLYKSKIDNYKTEHLGIKVHFNNNEEEVDENTNVSSLEYTKCILLNDILEINPEIKNIEFIYELIDINKYNNNTTFEKNNIVKDVIKYFNNIYSDWIEETIKPKFNEINCYITIEQII